ncbi:VOC family protein [Pararoseomonas indoligenes]|uniref:VOC family protein n=1 Tax=Roseomonas indoligenes TaxID=2820811 RepID=A0A940MZK3_9PROT|nr:VOC family protein [Pararoseomonas indoligenes]
MIPCLRYRDVAGAMAFLQDAFGLAEHAAYAGEGGWIEHAERVSGTGMAMLGSVKEDGQGWLGVAEVGGFTQTIHVVRDDVDAHCRRARQAWAEVVREPLGEGYRGRGYAARDPKGHVWFFGT